MKRILILISIMFLAGCVTTKFNVERANTYLLSHPDRPAQIKEAISVGEVVQGMNEEEVIICMGKPDSVSITQSYPLNNKVTKWGYLGGVPSKRVFILFRNGTVRKINVVTQNSRMINPSKTGKPFPKR